MKESIVEIGNHQYRYGYDSSTKKTVYLGPVGSSVPLSEEEFNIIVSSFSLDIPPSPEWDVARGIINRLEEAGFEAYVVGGAVRDLVMGREPKDYDIATSATPEEIKQVFGEDVAQTVGGEVHGTVLIKDSRGGGREPLEVTTFRKELYTEATKGRRPEEVEWTRAVEEDLGRRDFTINAMAMRTDGSVLDPYGGIADIKSGVIRAVGDPDRRFDEDRLRMLRAVRFASRFGFTIEPNTRASIHRNKDRINELRPDGQRVVSWERIRDEYNKGFSRQMFEVSQDVGLLDESIPEIADLVGWEQRNPWHHGDVYAHTMDVVQAAVDMDAPKEVRWAALLHDVGKLRTRTEEDSPTGDRIHRFFGHDKESAVMAEEILTRLKFSTDEKDYIKLLISKHMVNLPDSDDPRFGKAVDRWERRLMAKVQKNPDEYKPRVAGDLLVLRRADALAHVGGAELAVEVDAIRDYRESRKPVIEIKPVLSGNDLIALGYDPGPRFKVMLQSLLDWEDELGYRPTKEMAEAYIDENYGPIT
jgi:poly(A) polymerase